MAQFEYYAFISYKSEDAEWAEWLQKRIEYYKLPTSLFEEYPEIPHNIRPIFRDKSDLGAGILPKELNVALNASRFLIVICSTNAIKSPWVNNEVQHFIDAGRTEYIIPFIVDGIPYAGDTNECFPEAIRKLKGSKNELFGVNINELGKDAASVKVIARLLGLKFDALWGRYLKEEEKEKQRLIEQNNRLRTSKERASINKAFTLVDSGQNLLATRVALDIIDNDKKEGWKPLPEVEHLLRVSTMGSQEELFPLLSFDDNFLFSPDGKFLLLWDRYKVQLIELQPYSVKAKLQLSEWNGGPVFDINSNYIAIAESRKIHILGLGGTIIRTTVNVESDSLIEAMRFVCLSDELSLCVVYSDGTITLYNPNSGEIQHAIKAELNQSHHISDAVICDNYAFALIYAKSQDSEGVIVYKVSIHSGTAKLIVRIEEGYSRNSEDCTKLLYSSDESLFTVKDLVTCEESHIQHCGHPFYLSNSGLICFRNEDGTLDIVDSQGRFIADAPISRFWLSKDEKSCVFSLKGIDGYSIVYFNSDISQCPNYDGFIDLNSNAIEIRRYKGTSLDNLKVFGQHYVVTGGDFGVDIFDTHENRLVRHSNKGDDVIISSDFHHLIVSKTMSCEPSHLYRYSPFFFPVAAVHDYDILTLASSGAPIYYNLDHKGYIEFFTEDGYAQIALKFEQSICSLLDVNRNRHLAAFRVNDRPGFINVINGFCFDDSYVIIVNLKDFRCIDSVSSKVFQQESRIRFSHDGKWLLSINSTIKGLIAFSYVYIATEK